MIHNIASFTIFDQINTAFVSIKDFFQKLKPNTSPSVIKFLKALASYAAHK